MEEDSENEVDEQFDADCEKAEEQIEQYSALLDQFDLRKKKVFPWMTFLFMMRRLVII